MTLDEMKKDAATRVQSDYSDGENFTIHQCYEGLMDGTLISVKFNKVGSQKEEFAHVHFSKKGERYFRWHSDVLVAVSNHKERSFFFRLLEFAGIGGFIALVLTIIFAILICAIAFSEKEANPSVIEVVKLSFTIILGFFFGSQATKK